MEEEIIANRPVPESAGGERASLHFPGDPKVAGSSSVEIESGCDIQLFQWLIRKRERQFGEGSLFAIAEGPSRASIPGEEGARGSFSIIKAINGTAVLYEEGPSLDKVPGRREGAPVPASKQPRGFLH